MRHARHRNTLIIMITISTIAPIASCSERGAVVEQDRWYSALLQSQPIGSMHATSIRHGDRLETRQEMEVAVRRGGFIVEMSIVESFVETTGGEPIEARLAHRISGQQVTQTFQFTPDAVVVTTVQGENERREQHPRSADAWLPPAAAERHFRARRAAGDDKVVTRVFVPSMGTQAFEMTSTRMGPVEVDLMGKVVAAEAWQGVMSLAPALPTTFYVNEEGRTIKTSWRIGGTLELELVECDAELAQVRVEPPDVVAQTLVVPDRPIAAPRELRAAEFELIVAEVADTDDASLAGLPTAASQRVLAIDGRTARIRVDVGNPVPGDGDTPDERHRGPSTIINSDHPRVAALAAEALGGLGDDAPDTDRARVLCRFVNGFITRRDLSVGFASAGEVATTAQGDCTEFAVLLAALLRAAGVPSRTASGLVYIEQFVGRSNVFGYHMWTQAWLGSAQAGCWHDLDAALSPDGFDAAHIALATGALTDGGYLNDMLNMIPLLGRLSVRVLEPPPGSADDQRDAAESDTP